MLTVVDLRRVVSGPARRSGAAVGGENDGVSRQLGRFVAEVAPFNLTDMNIRVVWRRDRYLRASDHVSLQGQGYPAARLCLVFKQLTWAPPLAADMGPMDSHWPLDLRVRLARVAVPVRPLVRSPGTLAHHGPPAARRACGGRCIRHRAVPVSAGDESGSSWQRPATGGVSAAAAAGILAVCLIGLAATPSAHATLVKNLAERTPVGSAYPEVFEWLAEHTPAGKVVAYDRHKEFMTWSYANYGVAELFGIPPLAKENLPNYSDRWQAWLWLVIGRRAKPAGCLVRKYRIEFVVVGGQRFPGFKPDYSRARIAASPNVTLVHSDGGLKIYQVNKAGMVCANSE